MSAKHDVTVHAKSGGTSADMLEVIKPLLHKDLDAIMVHIGTNDLTKNVNTKVELSKLFSHIRAEAPNVKLALSQICKRDDNSQLNRKIKDWNNLLKTLCCHNDAEVIENKTFDSSCLGNKKGNGILARTYFGNL